MLVFLILMIGCVSGFILFNKVRLTVPDTFLSKEYNVSVIIPARNEEKNLPRLLESLKIQSYKPYEVIVINDFSTDSTCEIASRYDVKLIQNSALPDGWTGKTWAVWNGYAESSGDLLVFIDADVKLAPKALESLISKREKTGGVISIVPYHQTTRFYEKFSLLPCLLGVFAFTSPFERSNGQKGLYGACIVATREDYDKINGHQSIRGDLLDDLSIGHRFAQAGIRVDNFIGADLVSFRMYTGGMKSLIQGFGKGAVLSTATLTNTTVVFIAIWIIGLFACEFITPFLILSGNSWAIPFIAGYVAYTLQIIYFNAWTGRYGAVIPLLHILSSVIFIYIMTYSIYQVTFLGYVSWKGRKISVRNQVKNGKKLDR
ncbi:MAG: glycosyltransferase family 2 protein [Saccharofermentanales bacterium]